MTDAELQRVLQKRINMDTTYIPGGKDPWSKAFASVRGAGMLDELQAGQRLQAAMEEAYKIGFIAGFRTFCWADKKATS